MKRIIFALFTMTLLFSSCDKDEKILSPAAQLEIDVEKIENYLKENNLTATKLEQGVYYLIEEQGEGTETPTSTQTVRLYYKGYLLDGTVFDEANKVNGAEVDLNRTIEGWRIGIPKFKRKSKGKLFIPSGYAYGNYQRSSIPGKSVLIFDIEMTTFF